MEGEVLEFIPRREDCRARWRFRRFAGRGIEEIEDPQGRNFENCEKIYTRDLHAFLEMHLLPKLLSERLSIWLKVFVIRCTYIYIYTYSSREKEILKGTIVPSDLIYSSIVIMRVKKNEAISPLLPLYFIINGFIDDQILFTK